MSGTPRQKILIVEDDPVFQKAAAVALDGAGFDCTVSGDGLDAVRVLESQPFDVVLLDIGLPGVSGLEVLERIGDFENKPKVIVITSDSDRDTVVETVRRHAYQFLEKPVKPARVVEVVRDALAGPDPLPIEVVSSKPDWVELLVPCQPNAPERVQSFMQCLEGDMSEGDREAVGRAFRELLQNAVEWGGGLDPTRKVRISFQRTRRMLMYRIADPGQGFKLDEIEHAAVSNPPDEPFRHVETREKKGMRPGGFGLLMTRSLVDELVYNEAHNEVLFVKYLDEATSDTPRATKTMTEKSPPELIVRTRPERGALVAKLSGRLSAGPGVKVLRETLGPFIDSGTNRLVLDLSDVPYADSMGIEALISIFQQAVDSGGRMRLLRPSPKLRHLLELTKLTAVLGVSDDETAAINAVLESP